MKDTAIWRCEEEPVDTHTHTHTHRTRCRRQAWDMRGDRPLYSTAVQIDEGGPLSE